MTMAAQKPDLDNYNRLIEDRGLPSNVQMEDVNTRDSNLFYV